MRVVQRVCDFGCDGGRDSPVEPRASKHDLVESNGWREVADDEGAGRVDLRIEDPFQVRVRKECSAPCFVDHGSRESLGREAKHHVLLEAIESQARAQKAGTDLGVRKPPE